MASTVRTKRGSPTYRLRPGHAQVALTLLLALAGYIFAYFTVSPTASSVPVLFYVLLMLVITGVGYMGNEADIRLACDRESEQ